MPSVHNRKYDLYSPSSRKHSKPIIPVARLTRSDIESRLQQSIEIKSEINKYTARNEKQHFHSIPAFQLFPHDPELQLPSTPATTTTRDNNNNDSNEIRNLSLRKVPNYSLYHQVTETETAPILTLDTTAYIRKRQEIIDEQRNHRIIDSVEEAIHEEIPPLRTTEDVLQEVLSDSVLSTPVTPPPSTAASQPLPAPPQQPTVSTPQRVATSLGLVPEQFVPIMATAMQQKGCDTMRRITQTRDSSRMKINFEDMIGLLNHPLVALRDEYVETVDDKWSGSGKTLFIKQFVEYTQNEQLSLKIAIATYDIDMESFLYDCIKNSFNLPCVRIGSVLDDAWQGEYGIIFSTIKSNDAMRQTRIPNADLMIAFDIRLGSKSTVFTKISNKRESGSIPIIWLYTLGSVEQRAITYFETHEKQEDSNWDKKFNWSQNNWWSEKQEYQNMLLDENTWITGKDEPISLQAVKSLTNWAKNNFSGLYKFPAKSSTTTARETEDSAIIPSTEATTATATGSIIPQLSASITSITTTDDQVAMPESGEQQPPISPQQSSIVQRAPEIVLSRSTQETSSSDMEIAGQPDTEIITQTLNEPSDMDVDTDTHEHPDLPESVKVQVRQCFLYPSLQPVFERTPADSRQSSPSVSNRQRHRNNRWRGESNTDYEDDDDEAASFYSASEFVQDLKPISMLIESESSIVAGNSISLKLNPLKEAYEKEYRTIISRIQSQYNQEMKSLQRRFEQKAYKKLQNGS